MEDVSGKKTRKPSTETREKILETARNIAVSEGVAQLTIDAVAKKSKISKGGVLYHFPSKRKLIIALMDEYVKHLDCELNEAYEKNKNKPHALAHAFLDWYRKFGGIEAHNRNWGAAIFAVQSFDPSLMEPLQNWYKDLFQRMRANPEEQARTSWAITTMEGLFLLALYNLDYYSSEERNKVLDQVEKSLLYA